MNNHDRDNLNFLMNVDRKTLMDWFATVSSDDIDYAFDLLEAYSRELDQASAELRTDADMELLASNSSVPYAEANQVLSQFRLKSST